MKHLKTGRRKGSSVVSNKMIKIVYISFLIILLVSCSHTKIEKINDYYENGQVKTKKIFKSEIDSTNYILVEYHENGKIKRTGPIMDSIINGSWKYFYNNGKLMQKGVYIIDDTLNNGNWTYSYKLPVINAKGDTIKERDGWMCSLERRAREKKNLHVYKDGYWEFYHENGQLKSKGHFLNGWATGKWEDYSSNGQLIKRSNFKDRKANGEWTYWYPNGQLKEIIIYSDSTVRLKCFYLHNDTQTLSNGNGVKFLVDDNGDSTVTEYKNHLKHGMEHTYRKRIDNNNHYEIKSEASYVNGILHGKTRYFGNYGSTYEERMSSERNYVNGELHGYSFNFFNGKKTQIRYFVHGKEHGVTKHYHENTRELILEEPWTMGKRHGIRKFFDSKGVITSTDFFYNGDMIGYEKYENGKLVKQNIYEGEAAHFKEINK